MKLQNGVFGEERIFPVRYSKDGEEISPPIEWTDVPEGTRELALIFEDVTPRTRQPFAQWIVYKIPPDLSGLPEGFKHQRDPEAPVDVLQGTNSQENVGYDGPLGTVGRKEHLRFRVYALDQPLDVPAGLSKEELLDSMSGHIIEEAELEVTYERPTRTG